MPEVFFSKTYQHLGQQRVDVFINEPVSSEHNTTEIFLEKSVCSGEWDVCREGYFEINPKNTSDGESVVWGIQFLKRDLGNLREAKKRVAEMNLMKDNLAYVPGSHIRWHGLDVATRKYLGKEESEQ